MDRYIGLDVHASSSTLAIVGPSGRKLGSQVLETNGRALVEAIGAIPKPRHLCFEEGTQSAWLYEVLSPHVDEIVVTQASKSRGHKSDQHDALALAQALRLGTLDKIVFKAPRRFTRLRALVRVHSMLVRDVMRTQCRIKAMFRERAIATGGGAVYSPDERSTWLRRLPAATRAATELLFDQLDSAQQLKDQAEEDLVAELGRHRISRILQTCPGLGPIRTARLMAIVVTPHRFRTARQFWSYCGFAVVMRTSADWTRKDGSWVRAKTNQTRGLNPHRNPMLKDVFKGAANVVASQMKNEPLHHDYQRLLDSGTKPNLAKLTLARKLAATTLAMWKNEEVYSPDKHRTSKLTPG
jgi:transposase